MLSTCVGELSTKKCWGVGLLSIHPSDPLAEYRQRSSSDDSSLALVFDQEWL